MSEPTSPTRKEVLALLAVLNDATAHIEYIRNKYDYDVRMEDCFDSLECARASVYAWLRGEFLP